MTTINDGIKKSLRKYANKAFRSKRKAEEWLTTPNISLANRTPFDVATDAKTDLKDAIKDVLQVMKQDSRKFK